MDRKMGKKKDKLIAVAQQQGQVCTSDLDKLGISRSYLSLLAKSGIFRRITNGVYVLSDHISENESLQAISAAVPNGVICLLSALQFHEITTQMPMEIWVAIERKHSIPKSKDLPLRIVRLDHKYFECGVEEHKLQGMSVRIYSPSKTVVDCFRFRNKIGLDIAREALKDSLSQGKATIDEIYRCAKICRMLNVMRPYLEIIQ